jgi:hypothetical protein
MHCPVVSSSPRFLDMDLVDLMFNIATRAHIVGRLNPDLDPEARAIYRANGRGAKP